MKKTVRMICALAACAMIVSGCTSKTGTEESKAVQAGAVGNETKEEPSAAGQEKLAEEEKEPAVELDLEGKAEQKTDAGDGRKAGEAAPAEPKKADGPREAEAKVVPAKEAPKPVPAAEPERPKEPKEKPVPAAEPEGPKEPKEKPVPAAKPEGPKEKTETPAGEAGPRALKEAPEKDGPKKAEPKAGPEKKADGPKAAKEPAGPGKEAGPKALKAEPKAGSEKEPAPKKPEPAKKPGIAELGKVGDDAGFVLLSETAALPEDFLSFELKVAGMEEEAYYSLATGFSKNETEQYAEKVKQLFLDCRWDALAEEIRFPAMIDGTEVGTKEDFLKLDLENGLNPYFFVELEEETCREMFCNYQGIMMGATGRVWIADVPVGNGSSRGLKIIAVNGLKEDFGLPGGVSIRAEENDITLGGMTLILENETNLDIAFGGDYKLQICDETGVRDLEPVSDTAWEDIAWTPRRGEPVRLQINWESRYGKLEPGTYAISKTAVDLSAEEGRGSCERSFWFTIGETAG